MADKKYIQTLKDFFDIGRKMNRLHYVLILLPWPIIFGFIYFIILMIAAVSGGAALGLGEFLSPWLSIINNIYIFLYIFITIRRINDIGISRYWVLLPATIPLIYVLTFRYKWLFLGSVLQTPFVLEFLGIVFIVTQLLLIFYPGSKK